jgi:predicted transposase YdaD
MTDIDLAFPDTELEFQKALEEVGFVAKWEARGEAIGEAIGEGRKALEIAKNMLDDGFSVEQTAKLAELDIEKVRALTEK